jgi:hypothetical protein
MHISANYFISSSFASAMEKTRILEDDLRMNSRWWYPYDWIRARASVHASRHWWAKYMAEYEALGKEIRECPVYEALGDPLPWQVFPERYLFLLPPSCFPYAYNIMG